MKRGLKQVILTMAAVITFAVAPPVFAQQDTQGKPTVDGQIKQGGKEAGRAGTSLGQDVKRGRVVRGGKRFGKHIGYAGRHIGRGFKRLFTKAVKP